MENGTPGGTLKGQLEGTSRKISCKAAGEIPEEIIGGIILETL